MLMGGLDEIFGEVTASATTSYFTDALGSTVALTDGSGSTTAAFTYEPYGKSSKTGAGDTPFRYTGRDDDGTGLYYYRARYYHPQLARFVTEDPIGLLGGPNLYAYVAGNPLSYGDPLGLTEQDIILMRELVQVTQPDLTVRDDTGVRDLHHNMFQRDADGNFQEISGYTDPLTRRIWLDDTWLRCLTCDEMEQLYETITHEGIHATRSPWDSISRPAKHDDIYREASRRTDPFRPLIREYCRGAQ
jgi:RHS repeat-associated protein